MQNDIRGNYYLFHRKVRHYRAENIVFQKRPSRNDQARFRVFVPILSPLL